MDVVSGRANYSITSTIMAPPASDYRVKVWFMSAPGGLRFTRPERGSVHRGAGIAECDGHFSGGWRDMDPGSSQNVTWTVSSAVSTGAFRVWLYSPTQGFREITTAASPVAAGSGLTPTTYSLPWTVSATAASDYTVRVWYMTTPSTSRPWGRAPAPSQCSRARIRPPQRWRASRMHAMRATVAVGLGMCARCHCLGPACACLRCCGRDAAPHLDLPDRVVTTAMPGRRPATIGPTL